MLAVAAAAAAAVAAVVVAAAAVVAGHAQQHLTSQGSQFSVLRPAADVFGLSE